MGKVKWDSAADQILLTKILETHELTVDVARVAEAWPSEQDAKPTPRAIKERITKIKDLSKNASTGTGGSTSPVTPKKRSPQKKAAENADLETPTKKRKRLSKAQRAAAEKLKAAEERAKEEPNEDLDEDSEVEVKVKHEMTDAEQELLFADSEEVDHSTQPDFDLRGTSPDPNMCPNPFAVDISSAEENDTDPF